MLRSEFKKNNMLIKMRCKLDLMGSKKKKMLNLFLIQFTYISNTIFAISMTFIFYIINVIKLIIFLFRLICSIAMKLWVLFSHMLRFFFYLLFAPYIFFSNIVIRVQSRLLRVLPFLERSTWFTFHTRPIYRFLTCLKQ